MNGLGAAALLAAIGAIGGLTTLINYWDYSKYLYKEQYKQKIARVHLVLGAAFALMILPFLGRLLVLAVLG